MKKNLFLLFAIYFFVIQSWIISYIRNEARFFSLWIINLFVIIIVILWYNYSEKSNKKSEEESPVSFKKERESILSEKVHKKSDYKNKSFWISILFAIIAFVFFKWYLFSNKLIIASWLGFLLFITIFYLSKSHKHYKFLKLRNSRAYLIIFVLWLIISWFDASVPYSKQESAVWRIINLISNWWKYEAVETTKQDDFYKPEETVIIENKSWDIQEPQTIQTWEINTGETSITINNNTPNKDYLNDWDLTILDSIKYLLDENNIPLDTKQNMKFSYVSYQNSNYPYFKTAFMKKMIWTSTNPDKKIICQTYIVMKWIAESRDISTSSNSLQWYRDEANKLWKLNWCQRNKYVTVENL
jgi:hypothetical protein